MPLLNHRLASTAQRSLNVDAEISPLVRRTLSLSSANDASNGASNGATDGNVSIVSGLNNKDHIGSTSCDGQDKEGLTILKVLYRATTNRMLRVAVNGFMESIGVVLDVMEGLDLDVLPEQVQK